MNDKIRNMKHSLQKIIAKSGVASRREAEKLIRAGVVMVNNVIVTEPGTKIDPEKDIITVDGKTIKVEQEKFYYAFYKPRGCLSSLFDPKGRRTVRDYLPPELQKKKIIIAGRLDYNYTGLLILTNDGEFSNYITHPRYGVTRTYLIKLNKGIDDKGLEKLSRRIKIKKKKNNWIEVIVPAGEEEKILIAIMKVGALPDKVLRTAIGNITIGNLKPGELRRITVQRMKV